MNKVAFENIKAICFTELVSQLETLPLKEEAFANIPYIDVTDPVFHDDRSPLKEDA